MFSGIVKEVSKLETEVILEVQVVSGAIAGWFRLHLPHDHVLLLNQPKKGDTIELGDVSHTVAPVVAEPVAPVDEAVAAAEASVTERTAPGPGGELDHAGGPLVTPGPETENV